MIQTPPPTQQQAYELFTEALREANEQIVKTYADYEVVLLEQRPKAQDGKRVVVTKEQIEATKTIDFTEPVFLEIARHETTKHRFWNWLGSFFYHLPPNPAPLGIVNVVKLKVDSKTNARIFDELRDVAHVADVIWQKVEIFHNSRNEPKKYVSLGNGTFINAENTAGTLSMRDGWVLIKGKPIALNQKMIPASMMQAELPMDLTEKNSVIRLGDKGDPKAFFFHPRKTVEVDGKECLQLFRSEQEASEGTI